MCEDVLLVEVAGTKRCGKAGQQYGVPKRKGPSAPIARGGIRDLGAFVSSSGHQHARNLGKHTYDDEIKVSLASNTAFICQAFHKVK